MLVRIATCLPGWVSRCYQWAFENSQMLDASPNRTARPKRNAPGVESAQEGNTPGMQPTNAAADATRDPATDAAAVAFQPSLSPFWARKPHVNAVRLTSPLLQPASRQACVPPG